MIAKKTDPAHRLRMPQSLMTKVSRAAGKNGRSVNSELVVRVADSFKPKPKT